MKKRLNVTLSLLLIFVILLVTPFSTSSAANDVDTWGTQKITNNKKVWTVSFSHPLKQSTVKDTNVYIEDEDYRLHFTNLALSKDKKSIIVTPKDPYVADTTYRLTITQDVTSDKGKKLKESIVLPFILNDTSGEDLTNAIRGVTIQSLNFATTVTAKSDDSVNRVTVNGFNMHYDGNNTYSIGLTGLTSGDTVKVIAYDINGKKVFQKDYKVN